MTATANPRQCPLRSKPIRHRSGMSVLAKTGNFDWGKGHYQPLDRNVHHFCRSGRRSDESVHRQFRTSP